MKLKSYASLLLAAVLLSSALASCGNDAKPTETDAAQNSAAESAAETTAEPDILDSMKNIDLGGMTLNIDISVNETEWNTSAKYVMGPEEETGEPVSDHVYKRNRDIAEMLNCDVNWTTSDMYYEGVFPYIQKYVTAGDDTIDMFINDQLGLLKASSNGMLFNVLDDSYDSHFDFSSIGWYSEYMEQLTFSKDKMFVLVGDYFIDALRGSHVMYFNRNLLSEYFDSENEIYELVLSNEWTLDKLFYYVDGIYGDINGNGTVDEGDRFGLWTNSPVLLYYASDAECVDFDENGTPYLNVNYDRGTLLTDKILKLYDTDGNIFKMTKNPSFTTTDTAARFASGNLLFTYWLKVAGYENTTLRAFDGIGIAPYPLLDEQQDGYKTIVHDTVEIGAFPITVSTEKMSALSAYIQAMTLHSGKNLKPLYYENALKVKYAQDDASAQMLDIITEGISSPFEFAFNSNLGGIFTSGISSSVNSGTNVYVSTMDSKLEAANTALEGLIESLS